MADGKVLVQFGGDIGGLDSAVALAKAKLSDYNSEVRKLARELVAAGELANDNLVASFKNTVAAASGAKAELAALTAGARRSTEGMRDLGAGLPRHDLINFSRQIQDVGVSLASGQSPFTVLIQQGTQIADIFAAHSGGPVAAIRALGTSIVGMIGPIGLAAGAVTAAAGAAAYFANEARQAQSAAREFAGALASVGNLQAFRGELMRTAAAFEQMRSGHLWDWAKEAASSVFPSLSGALSISDKQASALLTTLAGIPNVSNAVIEGFAALAREVRGALGEGAIDQLTTFVKSLGEPAKALETIEQKFADLTAAEREEVKSARASGDTAKQSAIAFGILSREFLRAHGEQILAKAATEAHSDAERRRILALAEGARATGDWASALANASHVSDATANSVRAIQNRLQDLRAEFERPIGEGGLLAAMARLSAGTPSARITALTGDLRTLEAASSAAGQSAAELVKHFEGFVGSAKWDVNAFRVGFGSDTITTEAGKVVEVTQGMTTTVADAERDLARRVGTIQRELMAELGESWERLPARVQASLTSVAYNYGRLPGSIAAAAKGGDLDQIASAMRSRGSDNGGVNAKRREEEAQIVLSARQELEARSAISDQLQKQRDLQAGGSAAQKADAESAREAARGAADAVRQHERMVAAIEKELASSAVLASRTQLQTRLDQERANLLQAREQKIRADLAASTIGQDAGSPKWLQAQRSALAEMQALYARDSDDWRRLETEKAQISEQGRNFDVARAREAENQKFDIEKSGLEKRRAVVDAMETTGAITKGQAFEQRRALLEQEAELVRAHGDRIAALYRQDTAAYAQAQIEKEKSHRAVLDRIEQQQLQQSTQITAQFESVAQSLAGSLSGALSGLVTGSLKARDALRQVATSVLNQLIQMGVTWAAKQAGLYAADVALAVSAEAAKTTAVVGGVAARTAAETAGSTASFATIAAGVMKSIAASAGEVFAGVSGFLAPIMGPAAPGVAAGVATGVQATALSLAAFDVGAWNIDQDRVAMVHKGELVMTASQGDAFRKTLGMVQGGATAEQSGGQTVNVSLQVQANDAASFRGMVKRDLGTIAKMLAAEMTRNPGSRPSY